MKTAIDVSNYQPRDLSNLIQSYAPDTVIIRIQLPGEHIPAGYTLAQADSAHSWGVRVEAYVWGYGSVSPVWTMTEAVEMYVKMGAQGPLWLDCEADITEDWIRDAVSTGEALGVTVGIYTGYWWWKGHVTSTEFGRLPLWIAAYSTDSPKLPDGWDSYYWWQWTSDPIDQNVGGDEVDVIKVTDGLDRIWEVKTELEKIITLFPEFAPLVQRLFEGVVEIKEGTGLQ